MISATPLGPDGLLIWVLMITNAARDDWPGDVPIPDWDALGLRAPSKIRTAKVSSIETERASLIGRLPAEVLDAVRNVIRRSIV